MAASGDGSQAMIGESGITEVMPLGDVLVRAARLWSADDALVFPDRGLTFADLLDAATRRAVGLVELGVGSGTHVGILMANSIEFVEVLFATQLLGAVCVTLNARYKAAELSYVIENADLEVLVTSDLVADHVDYVPILTDALPGLDAAPDPSALEIDAAPELRSIVLLGETSAPGFLDGSVLGPHTTAEQLTAVETARRRVSIRSPAIMMYTSGTTAHPKGCPMSHETLIRAGIGMSSRYEIRRGDRFWDPLPMFHMSAVLPITASYLHGATLISMTHITVDDAINQIIETRPTIFYPTFPTLTTGLLAHTRWDEVDVETIRVVNNVAPPDTLREFQAAYPDAVQRAAYGLTEAGGVISINKTTDTLEERVTTCGHPFEGIEVRVVDPESGVVLGPDEQGEIQIRGYCLFEGYYRDPEKTAETMVDGWLRTGDLCTIDPEGRIRFHGRLKDMLKVGGENVAAIEIESFLGTHPAVKVVQVVAAPDARYVEVPAAFVELHDGAQANERDLIEFCSGRIASFKVPRYVRFVEDWPMSATKVQKFELRRRIVEELTAAEPPR